MATFFELGKDYLGNMDQIAYARQSVLDDGAGRGQRLIDVFNGAGLACTVTPDRAMNIVECSFKGIPLIFRASGGHRLPTGDFMMDWPAGLLTLCGLRNAGVPSLGEPQHGRISQMAAEHVGVTQTKDAIVIKGTLREGRLFGPNLRLERTMTVSCKENTITLEDTVTNLNCEPDFVSMLYHCNFGYPLVDCDTTIEAPKHTVEARDAEAKKGLKTWNVMETPKVGYKEQCFRHILPADKKGMASLRIVNKKLGIAVRVSFDTSTLTHAVEWKNCLKNNYVLGIEPTNVSLTGRADDLKENRLTKINAGKSASYKVVLSFETL